jgi:polysaccharide chain length determinant protein (PEP-CTERM system associated)
MNLEQGLQLGDLRGMMRRRLPWMCVLLGGSVLASVLVAALLPNEYEATTTLLIEPQAISEKLVESGVPETEINNRLHLIQMQILSRGRLTQLIDEFHLYPELARRKTRAEIIDHMREQISLVPVLPQLATEARAQVGIRPSEIVVNTFLLGFEHRSPKTAANVANRLAQSFIDEHTKNRERLSGDTSDFIQEELRRLSSEIERVERQIADIKTANIGTLPEDLESNQRLQERISSNLRDAQREYTGASSDEAFYRQQALQGGDDGYYGVMTPRRRLEALELQLAEYRSRGFTDKHPDVIASQAEIAGLRKEMASGGGSDPGNYSVSQQNARAEQQRASQRSLAAKQEMERLAKELEQVEERLGRTPKVAEQLAGLEREHEHLRDSYQDYSKKLLEAGVARDMESRQKGERFQVLEAAVPPPEATSPNRLLILGVGLLLGLALAGGYALAAESLDRSFHEPRQLQERFRLPVLAAIPPVVLASDERALRMRRLRGAVLAVGVTVLVLGISAAGYWWQNGREASQPEALAPQAAR